MKRQRVQWQGGSDGSVGRAEDVPVDADNKKKEPVPEEGGFLATSLPLFVTLGGRGALPDPKNALMQGNP